MKLPFPVIGHRRSGPQTDMDTYTPQSTPIWVQNTDISEEESDSGLGSTGQSTKPRLNDGKVTHDLKRKKHHHKKSKKHFFLFLFFFYFSLFYFMSDVIN